MSAGLPISPADQEAHLRQKAAENDLMVTVVLGDGGTVAGKAGQRRPGLLRLVDGIKIGAFDTLLVHSLHLLGRDLGDLINLLMTMRAAGVRLIAPAEQMDTAASGAVGLLDLAILFDAHRRFGKRERVLEGQQRARKAGVRIGRPPIPQNRLRRVEAALDAGVGVRAAGRLAGVSPTSVLRLRDEMRGRVEQDAPSAH